MPDRSPRPLLALLDELQVVARNGLTYGDDPHDHYDRERYERILHVVSEAYARGLDLPSAAVRERLTAEEFGHVTPKVGATGVVTDDADRVLLIERPDGDGWALPGGHADPGEAPEETVRREVEEETGVVVDPTALVDARSIDAPAYGPFGAITLLYRCEAVGGDRRPSEESVRVEYRDPATVESWFGDHASYVTTVREN